MNKGSKKGFKPRPILPWMGGKRRLCQSILKYFPEHTCYVEPFAGGASLFFAKDPVTCEVLNDQNGELINLYRVVQYHLEAFLDHFMWTLTSRENFDRMKVAQKDQLTDVQRAARFFYLQKHAFGSHITQQSFGTATTCPPRFNTTQMIKTLQAAHERLKAAYIESLDWKDIVKRYDRTHSLIYCDPPYWKTAGYDCEFSWSEYELLKEVMQQAQGMMMISINDHSDIRKLFEGFEIVEFDTVYSSGTTRTPAKELLIFNHAAASNSPYLKHKC